MIDLTTAAGALRFAELRRAEMTGCFNRLGRYEVEGLSFCAFVFATHAINGTQTGPKLARVEARQVVLPRAAQALVPPDQHADVFGTWLRSYAKVSRAIGVLVMNEQWQIRKPFDSSKTIEEQAAPIAEAFDDDTTRREVLAMWMTHPAAGHRHWMANIHRAPTRLDPWVSLRTSPVGGSLVNVDVDGLAGWSN